MLTTICCRISIVSISIYQKMLSPFNLGCCRYYPSCSQYAIASITKYGFLKGWLLATRRILCCHPFVRGGYDPIPSKFTLSFRHQEHSDYHE